MNSNDISTKITQYKNCYNKVVATKNEINNSIQALSNIIDIQNRAYRIDDNCATGGYLEDLISKQEDIISNIDNNILPNINRVLKNLSNQYIDAKQKEALENEVGF